MAHVQNGGVYVGVVSNAADPQGQGRVQVQLPSLMTGGGQWAAVCTAFGAPRNTGPSVGSKVLVAFENGDMNRPVVLGALQG